MPLSSHALTEIQDLLEKDSPAAERYAQLRQFFPGISVTRCDASDIDTETPALETNDFRVYLIDTSEHCVRITGDPEHATGLILAQK